MNTEQKQYYSEILSSIEQEGLYKKERIISSPQSANIEVTGGQKVLNMCANNYLGFSNDPEFSNTPRVPIFVSIFNLSYEKLQFSHKKKPEKNFRLILRD